MDRIALQRSKFTFILSLWPLGFKTPKLKVNMGENPSLSSPQRLWARLSAILDQEKDFHFCPFIILCVKVRPAPLGLGWRQRGSHRSEPSTSFISAPGQAIGPHLSSHAPLPPVCPILQSRSNVNFLLLHSSRTNHLFCVVPLLFPCLMSGESSCTGCSVFVATRHIACSHSYIQWCSTCSHGD